MVHGVHDAIAETTGIEKSTNTFDSPLISLINTVRIPAGWRRFFQLGFRIVRSDRTRSDYRVLTSASHRINQIQVAGLRSSRAAGHPPIRTKSTSANESNLKHQSSLIQVQASSRAADPSHLVAGFRSSRAAGRSPI